MTLSRLFGPWVLDVDRRTLRADALAGLLGAVLALPQSIAFAALAGLPPEWGLYTAIVPCVVAALAGSSRVVMSGPTNAVSLALAAMLAPLALAGSADHLRLALVVTLLVGLLQTALALFRLGLLANFISPSVMLGFTSGAALLIAGHAAEDLLHDAPAAGVALGTLALAALGRRLWPRAPTLLAALVLASLAAWALQRYAQQPLAFVGTLPQPWPSWRWVPLQWGDVPRLAGIAVALTIVSLGQTIAIAKVLAARSGQPLDVNRECLGQGLSNLVGPFFSCFVSSGSLNRSLPNLEAGARTPLAAVFAALFVLVLALAAAPLIAWVALAAIAGLLLWVAITLVDQGALAPPAAARPQRSRDRRRHAGGDAGAAAAGSGAGRRRAVAGELPVPHLAPGAAHDGLHPARRIAADGGDRRHLHARVPAAQAVAHGRFGLLWCRGARVRTAAGAAQRARTRAPPAGDGQEHELRRRRGRHAVGTGTPAPPRDGRRPVLPPPAPGGAGDLAEARLPRPPGAAARVRRQAQRDRRHRAAARRRGVRGLHGAGVRGMRAAARPRRGPIPRAEDAGAQALP